MKMKKQVMMKAWDIAKKAAANYGGKAIEFIGGALKIAWAIVKKENAQPVYIEVSEGSRNHKSYIAEIVGEHPRWGFDRQFVSKNHENLRIKYAHLQEGKVYEIQDAGDREYAIVRNGEIVNIEKEEVLKNV